MAPQAHPPSLMAHAATAHGHFRGTRIRCERRELRRRVQQIAGPIAFEFRTRAMTPQHARREEAIAMRGHDVDRAITDHDARLADEPARAESLDLLPFVDADL